jgi:AcrR family transcriptional regulator
MGGGLRERHLEATRAAILEAAAALFVEKGYGATTIDETAERAGVSKRTFFRHLPAKEALVFHDAAEQKAAAVADLRERLATETPSSALVAVLRNAADDLTAERGRWMAGLVAERAAIIQHHRGVVMWAFEDAVCDAVAEHHPELSPVEVRAGVAALLGAFMAAIEVWLTTGAEGPFPPVLDAGLESAAAALDAAGRALGRRPPP